MPARRLAPDHPEPLARRRRYLVATALVGAGLAAATSVATSSATAGSATARAAPNSSAACFWTPAADVLPLGPGLVATVRTVGTRLLVLHRVSCTDDTVRWMWVAPDGTTS